MVHMAELIRLMMLRPKWKEAEFLLTTALYRVDRGLANSRIWVTLTVQLLQRQQQLSPNTVGHQIA